MRASEVIECLGKQGAPCDYDWEDSSELDVMGDWCETNCRNLKNDTKCWRHYFQALRERRKHGAMADGQF